MCLYDTTCPSEPDWQQGDLFSFPLTGPVSPQAVTVDSVGSDHLILSWNISTLMRTTPHSYNVTTCTNKCDTLVYPYSDGSASMSISVSNLTSASEYFIEISAFVHRPDSVTGRDVTLRSKPTALHVKPGREDTRVIYELLTFEWKSVCFVMPLMTRVKLRHVWCIFVVPLP